MEPLELVLTENSYTKIMASFKSSVFGILMFVLIIIAAAAADNYTNSEEQLKVKFTEELDVRTLTRKSYQKFLADLREKLKVMDIGTTNKVAVLPPDNDRNPEWFDLKLTGAEGAQTMVRFRVGNLYVVGYQMGTTTRAPIWFEFGDPNKGDTKHWICNSQFLGFRGDYGELEKAAKMAITKINLNKKNLEEAVKTLATSETRDERAAALIVVVQLVSEACRFVVLSSHFSARINSLLPLNLEEWMLEDLEKNWGTYSKILLCYNMFPTSYKFPELKINNEVIKSADDLRKKLGIVLNVQVDKKECKITSNDVELPNVIEFQAQVLQNPVELAGVEA